MCIAHLFVISNLNVIEDSNLNDFGIDLFLLLFALIFGSLAEVYDGAPAGLTTGSPVLLSFGATRMF